MTPEAIALSTPRSRLADLLVLTKVRVNALVVATTAGGYYLGATSGVELVARLPSRASARRSSRAAPRRSTRWTNGTPIG